MKSEKEFLTEVGNLLDAIKHAPSEKRKDEMRTHLHKNLYSKKYRYGFESNDEVRHSVDYLKTGRTDPTKELRFQWLNRSLANLTKIVAAIEQERQQEKALNLEFPFLKGTYYSAPETSDKDKEIGDDLDLDVKYSELTEERYLYKIAGIVHAAMETQDVEVALLAVYHLHTEVYPHMHQFGFESKQSIRQRIDDWKAGKPDLDKEARTSRAEQWKKERGHDEKVEKPSLALVGLPGKRWMERLGIEHGKETPIPNDKEIGDDLDLE